MAAKKVMSILARRKELFTPLPKEQRLTEEKLILFERKIAKCVRKNESMLSQSEEYAAR